MPDDTANPRRFLTAGPGWLAAGLVIAGCGGGAAGPDDGPGDIPPGCGDGVVAGTEGCDGADLAGHDCVSAGFEGGTLGCTATCQFDVSECLGDGPECGNGAGEGLEACDGADHRNQSCIGLGFGSGQLACTSDCRFDTTGCSPPPRSDELATLTGCAGVYNPDQIVDYHIDGAGSLTSAGPVQFSCNDEPSIQVELEPKRGGGFKLDINEYDPQQRYFGLKKLHFDDSEGGGISEMLREYLSWRLMVRSGAVSSRAVLANVYVNGNLLGIRVNIERVDKRFLKSRFGDNDGWLYKKSGGAGDGLKTHESDGLADSNPHDDYFCFWRAGNSCAPPADLATSLPEHLALDQMLRIGAVNALMANTDSPIFKDNNYYFYDWPQKRVYLPWDLDTTMKQLDHDVFSNSAFASVLFPEFEATYDQIATELLSGPLTLGAIHDELDRVLAVAGAAAEASGDPMEAALSALKTWWTDRHAEATSQVAAH